MWLLSLPLALAGCLLGHAVGYGFGGESHREAEMHGYLAQAPLLLAILVCLALCALALRAAGRLAGRPLALPFLLITPLAFAIQESAERVVAGVSLHSLLEPAVLLGLAAQLPLALAAWLLARVLLRVADAVAVVLRRRHRVEHRSSPQSFGAAPVARLRPRALAFGYAGRAPPAL
jgi:hypothetical protein